MFVFCSVCNVDGMSNASLSAFKDAFRRRTSLWIVWSGGGGGCAGDAGGGGVVIIGAYSQSTKKCKREERNLVMQMRAKNFEPGNEKAQKKQHYNRSNSTVEKILDDCRYTRSYLYTSPHLQITQHPHLVKRDLGAQSNHSSSTHTSTNTHASDTIGSTSTFQFG